MFKLKQKDLEMYKRLWRYMHPYRGKFAISLLAMAAYGATDGGVPLLLKSVLDDIFGKHNKQMLWIVVTAIVLFSIFRGAVGFVQRYLPAVIGLRIVRDLRNDISTHLLTLSPAFFQKHTSGNLMARMTNDTLMVRSALTDAAASILRDSVRVVALLCVAFYLDPMLAAISFIGFPLGLIPIIRFGKKIRKLSKVGQDQFGGLTAVLQESVIGHRVVQSFTMEDEEQRKFARENQELTETFERAEKYGSFSGPLNEFMASILISAVIVYGGLSVIGGTRTQGDFIAFITSMFLLYEPLKKMGRVNNQMQGGLAAADRIFEILDEEPEIKDLPNALECQGANQDIEFSNVSFCYPGEANEFALNNVSLHVPAGKTLALVGMSGGGKSTLLNMLPRFYDPSVGEVRLGGRNIRDYKLRSLRSQISVVSQHTFLFNDTIFNNIAYGRLGADESEVIAAAKAANAHDFIMRAPEGYQTIIGEQGLKLSGGERSRIAIARSLLKNSPILLLDEATAALDSESEKSVQEAIDRLMQGRTVVVIAHRLATVRDADMIAVLVRGEVKELGTHDELLARGAEYARLYRLQFREVANA